MSWQNVCDYFGRSPDTERLLGYFLLLTGTVTLAWASVLKSKADRARAAKARRMYYSYFWAIVVSGAAINAFGTWLTRHSAERESKKRSETAAKILLETKEENARSEREIREKLQSVLVALNAAKHEDSKKITEEKIRVIQSDFSQWAEEFARNLPARINEFAQLKADFQKTQIEKANQEIQRQTQISGQSYPVLSFAVRFLEESVRAYAKRTSKDIKVDPLELPENFYAQVAQSAIHFNGQATWKLTITTAARPLGTPHIPGKQPYLRILFTDHEGQQSGDFLLCTYPDGNKISISYTPRLPTPSTATINGEHDLSDYESAVRSALQRVIEAQLLEAEAQ